MEKILILLMLMFMGCSKDIPVPAIFEPELFPLEIKEWGSWATLNSSSKHPPWNGLRGLISGHSIRNNNDIDLMVKYTLHIRGGSSKNDNNGLLPIEEAPLLLSSVGLLCRKINDNLDPFDIIESNIILAGEHLFAVAFAESKIPHNFWSDWWRVYSSVTIWAFTFESLGKGRLIFEYESNPVLINLEVTL